MSDELDEFLADAMVELGVPWQVAHCGWCGVALPKADHVCDPERSTPELLGILEFLDRPTN